MWTAPVPPGAPLRILPIVVPFLSLVLGPGPALGGTLRVIARFRPFAERELGLGCERVHTVHGGTRCDVQADGHPKRSFAFDQVFDEDSRQRDVYSILQVCRRPTPRRCQSTGRWPPLRLALLADSVSVHRTRRSM